MSISTLIRSVGCLEADKKKRGTEQGVSVSDYLNIEILTWKES